MTRAMILGVVDQQDWLIVAFVIVVAVVVMTTSLRRKVSGREPSLGQYTRQQRSHVRSQEQIKGDLNELLVELQELSRQITAQIDTRFAKLETVIEDADQRIARLERLLRRAAQIEGLDVTVDDKTEPPDPTQDRRDTIPIDPVHQQIYELADGGKTAIDIARELSRTTGEIELILNLRRSRETS